MPLLAQLRTFGRDESECLSMPGMYSRYYVENALRVEPFPGIKDLLERIKARVSSNIVTSKSRRGLDRVLKQFEWEDLFEVTVGADGSAWKTCTRPSSFGD